MTTQAFTFNGPIMYGNEPVRVEGNYYILEKGDKNSPTPVYRVLYIPFRLIGANLNHSILANSFFTQIFIDEQSATIGHSINQRPEPWPHPFYQELKRIVLDEYERNKDRQVHL